MMQRRIQLACTLLCAFVLTTPALGANEDRLDALMQKIQEGRLDLAATLHENDAIAATHSGELDDIVSTLRWVHHDQTFRGEATLETAERLVELLQSVRKHTSYRGLVLSDVIRQVALAVMWTHLANEQDEADLERVDALTNRMAITVQEIETLLPVEARPSDEEAEDWTVDAALLAARRHYGYTNSRWWIEVVQEWNKEDPENFLRLSSLLYTFRARPQVLMLINTEKLRRVHTRGAVEFLRRDGIPGTLDPRHVTPFIENFDYKFRRSFEFSAGGERALNVTHLAAVFSATTPIDEDGDNSYLTWMRYIFTERD